MRRALSTAIACAALLACVAPAAKAAFNDPLFVFTPTPNGQVGSLKPPPAGELQDPCGLGVDSLGRFYVSDYYHHAIDIYNSSAEYTGPNVNGATGYVTQMAGEDTLDGPCGLAFDASNNLYVNNYHRNVAKFGPVSGFTPGPVFDTAEPTGVAADSENHVYVDDRTSIAEYSSAGTLLGRIGEGSLADGYGVAVGSAGRIYVPDAGKDEVIVYDPSISATVPYASISGPPGGFGSLVDSAIAVDEATGELYVIDTLGPQFSEHPQATVYVFDVSGAYEGRLKYNVVNGAPSGLAVDNSATATRGRVYVTSGIGIGASIYAYPPGAASSAAAPPLGLSSTVPAPSAGQSASEAAVSSATPVTNEATEAGAPKGQEATGLSVARRGVGAHRRHRVHRRLRGHRR